MNVLIVSAHPEPQSFNTALRDLSIEVLKEKGHEIRQSDLYAMAFNPVSSANDFKHRSNEDYLVTALEQRHAWKEGTLSDDIKLEVEKLDWADCVIFNFPLYWFSVPAILKGWIDRVFISGFTYGGKRFYDQGGLKGKKALLTFTLGGREHMFGEDAIHGEIELMLRPLLRGSLYYVGMDVLPPFIAYHVPYISEQARQEILKQYKTYLNNLESHESLTFPKITEFDDQLYPIKK